MTLRKFLDVAYLFFIEESQRMGANLLEALEQNEQWGARTLKDDTLRADPGETAAARQNEASLQQLKQLMDGVQTT